MDLTIKTLQHNQQKNNMKKSNLSARLLPALFVAGALVFTGCSDSDYDFGNIDSTIGIGSDGLQIPVSTTENIKLGDILELEENGSVVEAANGDYVFRQDGGNVAPVHPFIDKIVVWKKSEPIITPVPVGVVSPTRTKGVRRNDSYVGDISGVGYLVEFHYKGEKPADVIEMKKAELKAPVTLRLKFDDNIKRSIQKFQELSLTFPNYMELADNGSLMTPTVNGRKVVFNDVPTSKDLVVKVNIKAIDFKAKQEYPGSSIKINGKDVELDGFIVLNVSAPYTGSAADAGNVGGEITCAYENDKFTIEAATGRFNPDIALNDLGDVDITGVPDFLKDGNVVADLYNPQISLDISNDMQVDGIVNGTIKAFKNGRETASVDVEGIRVTGGKTTHVCICRRGNGVEGYDQVITKSNLSDLIKIIPDNIKFTATATADSKKEGRFELGHTYVIQPSYHVDAPLAFAENAVIEYRDTLDGWHDDIKDMKLADGAYLLATANVTSCVPAYMSLDVIPVDADKKELKGIEVQLVQKDVKASADGVESQTSPLEVKIMQTDDDAMKRLDGLVLIVAGKASGEGNAVTGITLNAQKHTLKLTDIKIKMVGKVIGDFN